MSTPPPFLFLSFKLLFIMFVMHSLKSFITFKAMLIIWNV